MADKHWKAIERRIASFFGAKRTPLSGSNSGHTESDTLHKYLYLEIKARKKIPFLKTFKESHIKAVNEGKVPAIVMVEKGSKIPLLICNLNDVDEIGFWATNADKYEEEYG